MQPQEWTRIRELFERALDLPRPERAAFVDREARDEGLAGQVLRLLQHSSDDDALLTPPVADDLREALVPPPPLATGDEVGAYRIERLIGTGGMGRVYAARQQRPDRTVALKVMGGSLGPDAEARFELEAEVLGRLRHPGIAAIHELGFHQVPNGSRLSYFAMELVEGARDLLRYARDEGLDLGQRLELFRDVCAAVHHAHQRGVIHRDLKPGNILVDSAGNAKVIDYGVARASEPGRARAPETQAGYVLGTLQYISPEQLQGDSVDVDVRSDVYALGVVLYELIAGRPPYQVEGRPIPEVLADVCERTPPPPSRHRPGLSSELDWIVLRALEKERERRYGSAAELAEDLERFARQEPVLAGPPTARYRVRKFVQRHRVSVTAASLMLLGLVTAFVITSLSLVEARERREEAETSQGVAEQSQREAEQAEGEALAAKEVADRARQEAEEAREAEAREAERTREALRRQSAVVEALGDLIAGVQPDEDGRTVTVFELLERKRESIDGTLEDDPTLRAALLEFLTNAYFTLGLIEPAVELAQACIETLDSLPEPLHGSSFRVRTLLARLYLNQFRIDEAQDLMEQALQDLELSGDEADPIYLVQSMRQRALILNSQARFAEAADALTEAIELAERSLPADDPYAPTMMGELGDLLKNLDRMEEAEQWARRGYERAGRELGEDSAHGALLGMRLGSVLTEAGKYDESLEVLRRTRERMDVVFGPTHLNTLQTVYNLVRLLHLRNELDEARALGFEALEVLVREHGDSAIQLESSLRATLAGVLQRRGETEAQVEQLRIGLARMESVGQAGHPLAKQLRDWLTRLGK